MRWAVLVLLFLLLACLMATAECRHSGGGGGSSSGNRPGNPYAVLGIKEDATQEEIRQRYRKLCLRFHPDKNTHLSEAEQRNAERRFKNVQEAYSQIGTSDARKAYDSRQAFGRGPFSETYYQRYSEDDFAPVFRTYKRSQQKFPNTSFPFYFRFDTNSNLSGQYQPPPSSPSQQGSRTTNFPIWNPNALKSRYVQRVQVSLEDLYNGKSNMKFTLQNTQNRWKRYCAAFRGKLAYVILYESLFYALPLLRLTNRWVVALLTAILFDQQLPSLYNKSPFFYSVDNKLTFQAAIKAGYKEGTKLTFQTSNPMIEVVFILTEAKHACYRRIGNDLHVNVSISRRQAQQGCTIDLESLDHSTPVLQIRIPPGRIQNSGDCVTIGGKGWPIRKMWGLQRAALHHGDLIVHVDISSSRKQKRYKKRER